MGISFQFGSMKHLKRLQYVSILSKLGICGNKKAMKRRKVRTGGKYGV